MEHIRVLDLTRALSGPFCSMILGDLGAEVIKVEPAPHGEMMRAWGPFHQGVGVFYLSINRNKRSLAVDFRDPRGLEVIRRLGSEVDVLVENFKPGSTAAMGIDYETLRERNPGLVYASITGFGRDGPYGGWPGFDQIAQGMSGLMSVSGFSEQATRVGIPIGDLVAGMWTALGVNAALAARERTGKGQMVETSLLASLVGMLCVQGQRYLSLGEVPQRVGNDHPVLYPYGAFEARDGALNLAAPTQEMWRRLCEVLGMTELCEHPDYVDNTQRSVNRHRLRELINERLAAEDAMEWTRLLIEAGIPAGPIYDVSQVFDDPQVRHCGMTETVEHSSIGSLTVLSNPLRLSELGKQTVRSAPPVLGEHSEAVLGELGYAEDEVAALIADGVVVSPRCSEV